MISAKTLGLPLLITSTLWSWGQCVSYKLDTPLVSDRYTGAAQYGDQLILASAHGLVFKELNALGAAPLHVEAVAGDVDQVMERDGRLWVTAKNTGLYAFDYHGASPFPEQTIRFDIEGVQSTALVGSYMLALTGEEVQLYLENPDVDFKLLDRIVVEGTKIAAVDGLLFVHKADAGILVQPFDSNGFSDHAYPVVLDGESVFYDFSVHRDGLVVDSLGGVKWLEFGPDGRLDGQGYYFKNTGLDLVFDHAVTESELFLRFGNRLDVYAIGLNRELRFLDSISLPFSEVGITRMVPLAEHLHLLNISPRARAWSLTSYRFDGNGYRLRVRLDENFDELSGAAAVGERIFLSANRNLYMTTGQESLKSFTSFQPTRVLDGPITQIAGSESLLFIALALPDTPYSQVRAYEVDEQGAPVEVFRHQMVGTVSHFSQYRDSLAFLQFHRGISNDQFEAHVLSRDGDGQFILDNLPVVMPLNSENPFRHLQISSLGLTYVRDEHIKFHPNLGDLSFAYELALPDNPTFGHIYSIDDLLWQETEKGLFLYNVKPEGLELSGTYSHWHNLTLLSNNLLLAQSKSDRIPSRYHILRVEGDSLVHSPVAFNTSTKPIFIFSMEEDFFVAEKSSLSFYQFLCPSQDNFYLLPFAPGLELEISGAFDPKEVITMTIFNDQNQIIGIQSLTSELIEDFNGNQMEDWLFDFDSLEAPYTFILSASKPLAPIISGFANGDALSRFAYLVDPGGSSQVYVPHVPQDSSDWSTDVYLRIFGADETSVITIQDAQGNETERGLIPGSTEILSTQNGALGTNTPWFRVRTESLETIIAGFSLFTAQNTGQSAVVPLISQLSDFLIVPHMGSNRSSSGWTGLVLANPNAEEIVVRIIGYDPSGVIAHDRSINIAGLDSLVVIAEDFLNVNLNRQRIHWLVLAAELPFMGMALYGDSDNLKIAGQPLSASFGAQMEYPGIRANNFWETSLVITNVDPLPITVRFTALDWSGEAITSINMPLASRENLEIPVPELFPDLTNRELGRIRTVQANASGLVTGFLFRSIRGSQSLEAIRPLFTD